MGLVKVFLAFLSLFFGVSAMGQSPQETCKWVKPILGSDEFMLDSLSVRPSTIRVVDPSGKPLSHHYQIQTGKISLGNDNHPLPDSLLVCYDPLPFSFHMTYRNRSLAADYDSLAFLKIVPGEKSYNGL